MNLPDSHEFQVARDGEILGSFSVADIRTWLEEERLDGSEWGWCEGMAEWKPILELVEFPSATPKQRALLAFLCIPVPLTLTIEAASQAISDAIKNPKKAISLRRWRIERLTLYPELYAEEFADWKASRADEIHMALTDGEFEPLFEKLNVSDVAKIVSYLDKRVAGWDRLWADTHGTGVNAAILVECVLPAFALRLPQKLKAKLRGGAVAEETLKPTERVASEDDYMDDLIELQMSL